MRVYMVFVCVVVLACVGTIDLISCLEGVHGQTHTPLEVMIVVSHGTRGENAVGLQV